MQADFVSICCDFFEIMLDLPSIVCKLLPQFKIQKGKKR